ncbi:MAG: hypothetical protein AAF125_20600, partial [Chloroflexota bacterium]
NIDRSRRAHSVLTEALVVNQRVHDVDHDAVLLVMLGDIETDLMQHEHALLLAEGAAKMNPSLATAYMVMATSLIRAEVPQPQRALDILDETIEKQKFEEGQKVIHNAYRAVALSQLNQRAKAIDEINSVIANMEKYDFSESHRGEIHYVIALAYAHLAMLNETKQHMRLALKHRPTLKGAPRFEAVKSSYRRAAA